VDRKRLVVGELETAVLAVLWERGECTVVEVAAALPKGRGRHPNTVTTVLNRMAARGLVQRSDAGRAATFRAEVSREEMGRRHLEVLREEILGGSLTSFVAALVRPGRGKDRHAKRLRELLEAIEREERRER
jgi:BlaI family transcriptional regulator, penicillinase repressor